MLVPLSWIETTAGIPVQSMIVLGLLVVALCMCSAADAFMASSPSALPATAQLAFLVVGPAVDLKLIAMQAGTFGRWLVVRTAALAWTVAVLGAVGFLAGTFASSTPRRPVNAATYQRALPAQPGSGRG